jgi:hypothetical protein
VERRPIRAKWIVLAVPKTTLRLPVAAALAALGGYRNIPPANRRAIELMLVKVAQLTADLPEVRELDLNPVLADGNEWSLSMPAWR